MRCLAVLVIIMMSIMQVVCSARAEDGEISITNEASISVEIAVHVTQASVKIHSFYQIIHPGDRYAIPLADLLNDAIDFRMIITRADFNSEFSYPPRIFAFSATDILVMKQTRYLSVVIRAPGDCFVISKVFKPRDKHKNSLEENNEQEIIF